MMWTQALARLPYIVRGRKADMSLSEDYNEGLSMSHGSIPAGTDVVDVHNNYIEVTHTWAVEAQRNPGGVVMFIRNGEPYYVYDADVAWYD